MLSLWKLRIGSEAYYLSRVASGLEDYYTGQGEVAGRWVGHAISGLGLAGEVTGEDLQAVLAGLTPGTGLTPNGEQLRVFRRRVPGFDLTFSIPKSVSVIYALGDSLVQRAVVEAGQAAVSEALAWLEREACFVRRGTNNRSARVADPAEWGTRRLPGLGFVGAEFRHRTSRAELEQHAGIDAFTVPRFYHHTARQPLTGITLVIVDEAGMATTADLTALVDTAAWAAAKTLLVGDPHQLPEIGPGGGLAAAIDLLGNQVCELTINRRQRDQWEVDALEQLRHGDPLSAWHAYRQHGRVVLAEEVADIHSLAVDHWWQTHRTGAHSLLLAGTRVEAATLNRLARHRATLEGHLTGPPLDVADRRFQVGDRVLCTHNSHDQTTVHGHPASVDNGTLAVITAIHHHTGSVDIEVLGSNRRLRLTAAYLQAGHLEHGYAMTIHKAQGATCDHVYVVGPAGLYREAGYVALSRARHGARLYATTHQATELDTLSHATGLPLPGESDDPADELRDRLHRSQAKTLAMRQAPDALTIDELARRPLDQLDDRLDRARAAEHRALTAGLTTPAHARRQHDQAMRARSLFAPGRRTRALDWDNVGTIHHLSDTQGTAVVRFVAPDGATATRTLPWSQLQPIDHPNPVPLTPEAEAWIAQAATDLQRVETAWADELDRHGIQPGDRDRLTAAIELRTRRVTARLHADPPPWLAWWLGPRPADPAGANTYDDTLTRLATWRDHHHLPDQTPGCGPRPNHPSDDALWSEEMRAVLEARAWLTSRTPIRASPDVPTLAPDQIHERLNELDRLLATVPPEQTRTLTRLVEGTLTIEDLQTALSEAHRLQGERREWILTNWPHVVEHHELQRLADTLPKRDRLHVAVTDLLDRLATTVETLAQREDRTLAQLDQALHELDPGRHLAELTAELARTNQRLDTTRHELEAHPGPEVAALLHAGYDLLEDQQRQLREAVDAERDRLMRDRIYHTDAATDIHDAIAHRSATLLSDAVHNRPDWLTSWLTDLHTDGSLEQLPAHTIVAAINDLTHYRDRWRISGHAVLGPVPSPEQPQFEEWQRQVKLVGGPTISVPATTRSLT